MSRTITGHTTVGITLSNTADNPVKVALNASVITSDSFAIYGTNVAAWTLTNLGTLSGASLGVTLASGGIITNGSTSDTTASIYGTEHAVVIGGATGTITNYGTIVSATFTTVFIEAGGSVTNGSDGDITALIGGASDGDGVETENGATVANFGTINGVVGVQLGYYSGIGGSVTNGSSGDSSAAISGDHFGVYIAGGIGEVTNLGTITGSGGSGIGVDVRTGAGAVTVTNAGTIIGAGGTAIQFGTGDDRLVIIPGANFTGNVDGGAGTNVLELASAASKGTISGIGTSFTNFGTIDFDTGAKWKVAGKAANLSQTITGFAAGDTIDVTNFVAVSKTFASNTLVLTDASAAHVTLDIHGGFASTDFKIGTDHASGTDVELVCFAAGTRIAAPGGAVAVEDLRVDDLVLTADGRAMPVRWLGVQTVATRFADPLRALPIRICAGALGEQLPSRDLLLSPCHAVLVDGILINAGALVNGTSITRVTDVPEMLRYYHVELEEHVLLLAEGVAAESFLDGVEVLPFDNAAERIPRLTPGELPHPRVKAHRQVPESIRARTAARAQKLGGASRAA